jgi:hypothetical protein
MCGLCGEGFFNNAGECRKCLGTSDSGEKGGEGSTVVVYILGFAGAGAVVFSLLYLYLQDDSGHRVLTGVYRKYKNKKASNKKVSKMTKVTVTPGKEVTTSGASSTATGTGANTGKGGSPIVFSRETKGAEPTCGEAAAVAAAENAKQAAFDAEALAEAEEAADMKGSVDTGDAEETKENQSIAALLLAEDNSVRVHD